jgi:hypothetical protein
MSFRESISSGDNGIVTSDPEAVKAAAFRLKHDLGKAIRWSAPAVRETDPEALRRRLRRDLLETRVGSDGRARDAVELFEAWLADEGAFFPAAAGASTHLIRISAAIETIRRSIADLGRLEWDDLVALDEACRVVEDETRSLWRESVASASKGSPP